MTATVTDQKQCFIDRAHQKGVFNIAERKELLASGNNDLQAALLSAEKVCICSRVLRHWNRKAGKGVGEGDLEVESGSRHSR